MAPMPASAIQIVAAHAAPPGSLRSLSRDDARARDEARSTSAQRGRANAARLHTSPQPATGTPVHSCTALANGESQIWVQLVLSSPRPQKEVPPVRAATSWLHWKRLHRAWTNPRRTTRPRPRALGRMVFVPATRSSVPSPRFGTLDPHLAADDLLIERAVEGHKRPLLGIVEVEQVGDPLWVEAVRDEIDLAVLEGAGDLHLAL